MYLMIDNYDSFVYNLVAYLHELSREVLVMRNDAVDFKTLEALYQEGKLQGIILSPGPKRPEDSGACLTALKLFEQKVPILGVCLGHQTIAYYYGATVRRGHRPMHGKISPVYHEKGELFHDIPNGFRVTRYHSLVVDHAGLPSCLKVEAVTGDREIMALRHRQFSVYGVQFHPEAVLTEHGHRLLENFLRICEEKIS